MIARAFCLILLGSLDGFCVWARASDLPADPRPAEEAERQAGFEAAAGAPGSAKEDPEIFAPLSPIAVEAEPVKLPSDQLLD